MFCNNEVLHNLFRFIISHTLLKSILLCYGIFSKCADYYERKFVSKACDFYFGKLFMLTVRKTFKEIFTNLSDDIIFMT